MSDQTKRIVQELRATAQLMTLDPGVFCVFNQGPVTTDANGLPGVRITVPPGAVTDRVQISAFRPDGWLGGADSAALIRVNGGQPAQVLVTVYQGQNGTEAPRLQVVRLTDVPPAQPAAPVSSAQTMLAQPAARPAAAAQGAVQGAVQGAAQGGVAGGVPGGVPGAAQAPAVRSELAPPAHPQPPADQAEVAVHINRMGDVLARLGDWAGERGSQRWIEGFALSPRQHVAPSDIEYQAVLGRDWLSPWAEGGQYCGSRGMSLPLLGLRVRLRGAAAAAYDLMLEATFVDGTTTGPVPAGEACETTDLAALEAFKLTITPKAAASAQARPARRAAPEPVAAAKSAPAKAAPAKSAPAKAVPVKAAPVKVTAAKAPAPAPKRRVPPTPAAATPAAPTPAARRGKPGGSSRR